VAEIDLTLLEKYYDKVTKFAPLPKYDEESRDLALVMDKAVSCGQVEKLIKDACAYVSNVTLFDVYEGAQIGLDKKSMAFSVKFTPKDEEFSADAVDAFVKKILKKLKNELQIDLRS